jgi:5-formyltetrahydrofolate cyclo-ligase
MREEISPLHALEQAQASGRTVAYPGFTGRDHHMIFRAGPALEPSPWSFMQPAAHAPAVSPDLLLVPLVAIDRRGHRIGQGKGYYDRVLPELRSAGARIVGLGWPLQLVDQDIPHDPWDVPLDAFASPDGLIEFSR